MQIETHPLAPFLPPHAKVLLLGSFPPQQHRWKMQFYYPNFQNDMWRIFGLIFFENAQHFLNVQDKTFKELDIREFLYEQGIAIYDTAYQVIRRNDNAADKFLEIYTATDIAELLQHIPACQSIITTGDKATQTLIQAMPSTTAAPKIGQASQVHYIGRCLNLYRLPSSSRAYPLALEKKALAYANVFKDIGLIK
jgi:G:T/U-mismatch repair DNA glycosylase